MITKKCLKLFPSGEHTIPGTGSVLRVLVSLTILGDGPSMIKIKIVI